MIYLTIRLLWVRYAPWNSQYWTKGLEELGFTTKNSDKGFTY